MLPVPLISAPKKIFVITESSFLVRECAAALVPPFHACLPKSFYFTIEGEESQGYFIGYAQLFLFLSFSFILYSTLCLRRHTDGNGNAKAI